MTKKWAATAALGALALLAGCAGGPSTGQPASAPANTPTPTASVPAYALTICADLHRGDSIRSVGHQMWANSSIYPDEATAIYDVQRIVQQYCPQYAGQ